MKDDDHNVFFKSTVESMPVAVPKWGGIDWAFDSGRNRGDIVKRDGNVTHVRFKPAEG